MSVGDAFTSFSNTASEEDHSAAAAGVSTPAFLDAWHGSIQLGLVKPGTLRAETGIDEATVARRERVSEKELLRFWQALERLCNTADYGLRIGARVDPATKGLLASWVSQCQTLGEALGVFVRHTLLMSSVEQYRSRAIGTTSHTGPTDTASR